MTGYDQFIMVGRGDVSQQNRQVEKEMFVVIGEIAAIYSQSEGRSIFDPD